jgi:hypothetical protein
MSDKKTENEAVKKLLLAAGLVLAATSASMAQGYIYGTPYGGSGAYDYSPGLGSGYYDYAPDYSYGGNCTRMSAPTVPAAATARSHSADAQ